MEPFDSFDEFDTPKTKPVYEESVEELKQKEIITEVVGIPEETKATMPKSKKKKKD